MNKHVMIIGAGPAGLTAALQLQSAGVTQITVLEASDQVGGISRTVNYHNNRIDIGGHRFFSKSDWVMNWWTYLLPLVTSPDMPSQSVLLQYQGRTRQGLPASPSAEMSQDDVMLVRNRLSRIYFNRNFFDYPLKLNFDTLRKLGPYKTISFGLSYIGARINPRTPEVSLEDFLINRFGLKLYRQFFKEYTEKVWGVPCSEISADWGAQRIKSLSIIKAMVHAAKQAFGFSGDKTEQTSLIESFIYPKYGPGQMWEAAAKKFEAQGGKLLMQHKVIGVDIQNDEARSVVAENSAGCSCTLTCSHIISTMPIKDLVAASPEVWTDEVRRVAGDLQYRDFITVGLLYKKENMCDNLKDNWIYIQEPGVNVGRVQIFNNWSPYMVSDPETIWLGLEFFCIEKDSLWNKADDELILMAQMEMQQIALVKAGSALDAVVIRVPKAYPGYFGSAYKQFKVLRQALDRVQNLFLVGRNGMHRYNNQDHSMLTAKEAVDQIVSGNTDKAKIWAINVDDEYHEEK